MNNKLTKIWGVGLVLVLLVSMFGLAVPASAGTLSWTIKANADVPSITNEILATNSDLIDMAVSSERQFMSPLISPRETKYSSPSTVVIPGQRSPCLVP